MGKTFFKYHKYHFCINNLRKYSSYEKVDHKLLLSKHFKSKSIRKHLQMNRVHVLH